MILTNARGFEYGVQHFFSPKSGQLSTILQEALNLELSYAQELINLGSIYVEKQRCLEDKDLQINTYIRAHTKPRLFPPSRRSGKTQVLWENENFLLVDKPHGLPCHPTVDNIRDNLLAEINRLRASQGNEKLYLTHRLDVPTSGVLVLAKSTAAQSAFNQLLKDSRIEKIYEAELTRHPEKLGLWSHWMEPSVKAPKKVIAENPEDPAWQQCLLEIQGTSQAAVFRVKLITGRTHQIRAQCSAMGAPIVGDTAYGAPKVYDYERIHLRAKECRFIDPLNQQLIEAFA